MKNPYPSHPLFPPLIASLRTQPSGVQYLEGLTGSSRSALIHACVNELKGPHLMLFQDKEEAAYFYTDLVTLDGSPDRTLFFPSSYRRSVQYQQTDEANIITRTQTLRRLSERRAASFIVSYAEALVESVLTRQQLGKATLEIRQGEKIGMDFLEELLQTYGFQLVDFVYEPGQYAIRGGIADIFSYASTHPCRLDFFGDEVESIRIFDTDSQRSLEKVKKVAVIPNIQWETERGEKRISFLEYIPPGTILWVDHPEVLTDQIETLYRRTDLVPGEDIRDRRTRQGAEDLALQHVPPARFSKEFRAAGFPSVRPVRRRLCQRDPLGERETAGTPPGYLS
jgi:transcription-repair coupling factor (superfamily II helicase)